MSKICVETVLYLCFEVSLMYTAALADICFIMQHFLVWTFQIMIL